MIMTASTKRPFYDLADPAFTLRECANKLLTERRERYLAELHRLATKCRRNGYEGELVMVEEEARRISNGELLVTPPCNTSDFAQLLRARACFDRDTQLIVAHLPSQRFARVPRRRSLERLFFRSWVRVMRQV